MRLLVPVIHRIEHGIRLMHRPHRRFSQCLKPRIGDNHRQFDNAIAIRIEPRHLHVQPDQVVCVLCHIIRLNP